MTPDTLSPFRILVVCTGNICRSPQAERLLASAFAKRGAGDQVEVTSAGTSALVGRQMEAEAARVTAALGASGEGHSARALTSEQIENADLVLTMERAHRADVVRAVPRASRVTFTLPEFERLVRDLHASGEAELPALSASYASRLRALVPQVAAGRGMIPPVSVEEDEVEDPYRQSPTVYERVGSRIASLVESAVETVSQMASAS